MKKTKVAYYTDDGKLLHYRNKNTMLKIDKDTHLKQDLGLQRYLNDNALEAGSTGN